MITPDFRQSLYLVRKNLRVISAPMSLSEIVLGFQKMEIGVLDEVCGHAGPWIQISSAEKLRQVYPQLANSLANRLQLTEVMQTRKDKKSDQVNIRFASVKKPKKTQKNVRIFLLAVAACASIGICLRILIVNYIPLKNINGQVGNQLKTSGFLDFDCHKSVVEGKWSEAQPGGRVFSSGLFTPKNMLLKILFWDPYWILRHTQISQTNGPTRAFFEGCLATVKSTLATVNTSVKEREFVKIVNERLKLQLNVLRGVPATTQNLEWTHSLQVLNCFDSSNSMPEFERCRQIQKKLDPDFQKILEDYEKYQLLRVGMSDNRTEDLMVEMRRLVLDFPVEGSLGRLDYHYDLKLLKDNLK